jgi:hypothetical protein
MDHRKTKKCALTAFAAKLLAKQFALCPDPNAAAEEMIIRGWSGFKADWIRTKQFTPSAGYRKPNAVDALQQIFEERGWHEPEFVHGDNRNGECIPPERGERQGVVVDLRAGAYRRG